MAAIEKLALMPYLLPSEIQAVDKFIETLLHILESRLVYVALFGSKARGDSEKYSDIDLLVVVTDENWQLKNTIIDISSQISLDFDVVLSPRVIGQERWQQMGEEQFTLYRNISREGIPLFSR
jgi:predicted nucleotidyltransferase